MEFGSFFDEYPMGPIPDMERNHRRGGYRDTMPFLAVSTSGESLSHNSSPPTHVESSPPISRTNISPPPKPQTSKMEDIGKQIGSNIGESLLAGAIHVGTDYTYSKIPLNTGNIKMGAMAAGSHMIGKVGAGMLLPMIPGTPGMLKDAEKQFLPSLASAGTYVIADNFLKWDGRTPAYKFMQSLFTSLGASYTFLPIKHAITGQAGY